MCSTCRAAHIVEFSDGHREVRCYARSTEPLWIVRPVVHCNDYDDQRVASKWDMEKIAWTVTTNKSGQAIGFAPPKPPAD
jgi:hypothetical protein